MDDAIAYLPPPNLAYTPANSNHWASPPPATLAEALDRLAARVSNNGAQPV